MNDAPLRGAVAALSLGAGVLHASVVNEHADEWLVTGGFFVGIALFQGAWGALVLNRSSRALYWVGAAVNAGVIALWVLTRTAGLPFGPEVGLAEPVGLVDTVATGFEVLLVAGALRLRAGVRYGFPALGAWLVGVAVVMLCAGALLAPGTGRH